MMNNYAFARLAVDKAKLCPVGGNTSNPPPRVAIVLSRNGELVGWAAKGVGGECIADGDTKPFSMLPAAHAEQALLEQLQGQDLSDVTAFVTLEPCTKRRKGMSCAEMLVSSGIREVYIGNCDPNPDIGALAWREFLRKGVSVKDFPAELRNEARRDNAPFFEKFNTSFFETGNASFDYSQNGGQKFVGGVGRQFRTSWSNRGLNSIYAIDHQNYVALAKNCSRFDEIDDPGRWFEDSDYTKPVSSGEIVVFRNEFGYALVLIRSVRPASPGVNAELNFTYTIRYFNRHETFEGAAQPAATAVSADAPPLAP